MFKQSRWILVALILIVTGSLLSVGQAFGRDAGTDMERTAQFLSMMDRYLELSDKWVEMISRENRAIYLAIEGITEIYEERGEKAAAIEHLRQLLERHGGNQTVRNAVHFKLRDIYRDTGQSDKALAELDRIVRENT